jgi:protein required for attachment to host cells
MIGKHGGAQGLANVQPADRTKRAWLLSNRHILTRRGIMQTRWIIAADSSRARIFEMDAERHLTEIDDLINPAGRAANRELNTDETGRFFGKARQQQGHTVDPEANAVQHEEERFSKYLSDYLDKARNEHRYDSLCVFAAPEFLGMMRQSLSTEVQDMVEAETPKNISWFDKREIEQYVQSNLH